MTLDQTIRQLIREEVRAALREERELSPATVSNGHVAYLDSSEAGTFIGADKQRIYDLKSCGDLVPDAFDGSKPLYLPETLTAYVTRDCQPS